MEDDIPDFRSKEYVNTLEQVAQMVTEQLDYYHSVSPRLFPPNQHPFLQRALLIIDNLQHGMVDSEAITAAGLDCLLPEHGGIYQGTITWLRDNTV